MKKHAILDDPDFYYSFYVGGENHGVFDTYLNILHYSSEDMGGTPYGIKFPLTTLETVGTTVAYFIGQLVSAQIFGDFDNLLALFDEENLKNR